MPSSKKNSDIQYKAAPQGMVNLDEAEGIVECFVAGIGNKDSVGDVCAPGAFGKSLIRRKPRVVWGHNWNDPIGKVLDMYEVPPSDPRLPGKMKAAGIGGLYARVQFNLKSEKGREAFANVAFFGVEQEWSIGYKTINAKFDPQMQANILYEVELYEVSPVLHGANQLTGTISIKSEEQPSNVLVNEKLAVDGLNVSELSSVLDALKTIASVTDEKCGPIMPMGVPAPMMMPMGMPSGGPGMPSAPKPMQSAAPRDAVKPEVPSMPENPMLVAIRRELVARTGSNIIVRSAAENNVVFDRITSDGISSTYRLPYHFMNGEFMFGKPEKINMQANPESSAPEMPGSMPQVGAYGDAGVFDGGKSLISFEDSSWGEGFGQQIPAQQVDVSTLNSAINSLEKIIEEKSTYIIPVEIENAFEVKQAIDPILDYYRVEATVTENGIIIKSLDNEFLDAVDIATKGVFRSIGNMIDRAVDRPRIGDGHRDRRDMNPNLASRSRGIGSRGAVVRLSDGTMWDPKNAPDRNNNGIVGEGLFDGRGMSLSQPDPTPDGPNSIRAPKTPKAPKAAAPRASRAPKKTTRLSSGATDYDASFKRNGWKKKGDKWSKGNWEIEATGPYGLSAYNPKNPETLEQERDPSVSALRHLNQFERILRGSDDTNFDDDTTRLSSGRDDAEYARELAKQRGKDRAAGVNATNPIGKQPAPKDRGNRLSSGEGYWVDAAEKEAGNDPRKLADFLIEQGILEEDHPRVKKLRNRLTADDEFEKTFSMLAEMDAEAEAESRAERRATQFTAVENPFGRLSSGEWTKNTDGYEMDAPDIEGVYDVYETDDGKFIVTRYSDYNRNGGQDAQEYEHDKEFATLAAAKKWVEKDYAEAANEYGTEMDDEDSRLSSGKIDFDKKGASGLREMRHVERNPLRYDTAKEKEARDAYEKLVADFKKNNGWFIEVPMYSGDPKWQSEDWYRAREFATNVATLRFQDDYQNNNNQFMQFFDKPGKPSKKDFFANKGTVDYKSWYMAHTPLLTGEIDSVINSDQYPDDYKESYMDAIRSFLYVNRPEFGPYQSDDSVKAYDAWLQQAGLGWGGRYSNSGPKLDEMSRFSSGAKRGNKKDNFIRSYENPEDLKEAMFTHLIANNMGDYQDMTAEDLAYALNVRSVHVEPLLEQVKKDVSDAIDEYEQYSSMRPEMTDAEMEAMAQDFARAQTITDKFADMTDEEAADYAAWLEEETWRDRDPRFSSGEMVTGFDYTTDYEWMSVPASQMSRNDTRETTASGGKWNGKRPNPLKDFRDGADLSGADLRGGNISGRLRGANFRGADLRNVMFQDADISFADFTGADTTGWKFYGNMERVGVILPEGVRFSSGSTGDTPEERISNYHKQQAEMNAILEQMTPEELKDYAEQWNESHREDSRLSSGSTPRPRSTVTGEEFIGRGYGVHDWSVYDQEDDFTNIDEDIVKALLDGKMLNSDELIKELEGDGVDLSGPALVRRPDEMGANARRIAEAVANNTSLKPSLRDQSGAREDIVHFNYNGKQRSVYPETFSSSKKGVGYFVGWDATADDGKGAYRSFNIDKIEGLASFAIKPSETRMARTSMSHRSGSSWNISDFSDSDNAKILSAMRQTEEFRKLDEAQNVIDGYVAKGQKRVPGSRIDIAEIEAQREFQVARNRTIDQMIADGEISPIERLSSGNGSRPRGKTVKYGFVEDKSPRYINRDGKFVEVNDGQNLFVDLYDRRDIYPEGSRASRLTIDEIRDENGKPTGKFALGMLVWDDYEGYYDDEPDWDAGTEPSDEEFDSIDSAMEFARNWAKERGQIFGASREEMDDEFWYDSSVTRETARAAFDADFERYMAKRDAEMEAWRAANPEDNRFSSGRSIARRQGKGKNSRARGQRPWSEEDRQNFADGNRLRAQTIPGKRREGPSASEFSSGERLSTGRFSSRALWTTTPEGWEMPEIGDDGEIKDGPLKGFYIRRDDFSGDYVPGRKYIRYDGRGQYQETDEFKKTVIDWTDEDGGVYELGHTLDRNISSDEDIMGLFDSSEQETMDQYGDEGIYYGNSSNWRYDPQNDYELSVTSDEHSPEDGAKHVGKAASVTDDNGNKLYGIVIDGYEAEYREDEPDEDYRGGPAVARDGGLTVLATHDADGNKLDKPVVVEGTFGIEAHQVTNASEGLDLYGPRISVSKSEVSEDTFDEAKKLYKELDPFENGKSESLSKEAVVLFNEYRKAQKEKNRLSSGARFAPEGESSSRINRRLSSGELKGPPPKGSGKYNREKQVGATMGVFHSDPSTAIVPSDASGILGPVPSGRDSHILNAAIAQKIIANPDMEYSADNGWPVDAGKLLDFIEVNDEEAIKTLREIGDAQRISTILGIPQSDAQDMLDGKPVYIASSTAADMFDKLSRDKQYEQSVGGLNDVARVWGYEGAPKWVRHSDIATPEFDLDENDEVNWSKVKWEGLSKAEFDAEVRRGKNPPEPVYVSPVEFFNGDAIASNPKWDARGGSFKNPTVDSEFTAVPKKIKRSEQLEPTRAPSQARVGQTTARADKDFAKEWIKRGHGVSAANMMDILGIERDSKGEDITNAEVKKLLVALNEIRAKAGLKLIGNDGVFRDQTVVDTKNKPIPDDVMHALITSGRFKSMKEALASIGDPRLDSLAAEYDSRMLVDAALIRIKDKMNKDGVANAGKIITDVMTTAFGRNPDKQKRVLEGRVSIAGDMKEDGMIGDDKIAEIIGLVNEKLAKSGLPEINQEELFPKDETGGYVENFSSTVPGSPRMSSGQRFVARTSSSRRADAMNDAAARREGNVSRLSSGEALPLRDENGKMVPRNIEQAARAATPTGPGFDNDPLIQRKTPQQNLEDFEKAVKTRQEISKLFTMNRRNTQGFTVYDYEDELVKAGFPEEEIQKMIDSFVDLDTYIDDVERHFEAAREKLSESLDDIEDSLSKIERLRLEKADAIKKWGNTEDNYWVQAIDDKIAAEMIKIDKAYQTGVGGEDGRLGTLHPQIEQILTDMPGWSDKPYGAQGDRINRQLLRVEASITKAGGMKKAVPVTGIDFGVPEGTRLSSGKAEEYYQNLTSHLINMIEKSQKEGGKWEAPWHKAGNLPRNASTKNMYSGGNLFALMLAAEEKGYTTPHWGGFQQWKKLGGSVKKGEKATVILMPKQMFGEEIDPDTGKKIRKSKGVYFTTAHVFNLDQVEGIDREEFLKLPTDALTPEQKVTKLEDAIKEVGADIRTGDGSRAYYSPREDHVVMPPFELFKSPEGYYGTLAHELVHWTGHSSRLDRKNMNQFGSPDYAREELVAEFGSAFLLAMFGLSAEPREDHAHYLANWLQVLRDEPNALQEASQKAQEASKMLIEKMKAVLEEMGETASDAESTAESAADVKSLQIFNDPLYEFKDASIEWIKDPLHAPFLIKSLDDKKHSSGLVNRSWERIAETVIFLERLSNKK